MSFILDALKKSERERQKQSAPALFEVKVAPPRNRFPVWAVVIGVLLAVNMGVVLWLLLRNTSKAEEAREVTAANAPPAATQQASPQSQVYTPPPAPAPYTPPADYRAPPPAYDDSGSGESAAAKVFSRQRAANNEPLLQETAPPAESVLNPEDYEPAREAPQRAARQPASTAEPEESGPPARNTSGVPTYQDAAAMPGLNVPQLRLDLHVYDPDPASSFVFVNMQKLKQGDSFDQGVRVESITPDGAILSYRGVRFLLRHE